MLAGTRTVSSNAYMACSKPGAMSAPGLCDGSEPVPFIGIPGYPGHSCCPWVPGGARACGVGSVEWVAAAFAPVAKKRTADAVVARAILVIAMVPRRHHVVAVAAQPVASRGRMQFPTFGCGREMIGSTVQRIKTKQPKVSPFPQPLTNTLIFCVCAAPWFQCLNTVKMDWMEATHATTE